MKKKSILVALIALGVGVILGLLVCKFCQNNVKPLPAEQLPPPPLTGSISGGCLEGSAPENEVATNGIFIDNQLLLDGPADAVRQVAEQEGLTLIQLCTYDSNGSDLATGLYNPPDGTDPEVLRDSIDRNEKYSAMGIIAELNYLIEQKDSGDGSCADPYSDGGSPYSDGGSPDGSLNRNASGQELLKQWAIRGVGLTYQRPAALNTGTIHIAIFDTAPHQLFNPRQIGMIPQNPQVLDWPNAAENDVNFYLRLYNIIGNTSVKGPNTPFIDVSDHGMFVAGLARIVAPDGQFHLIRVLDDNGCGDLRVLVVGIHQFMALMSANGVQKVVLNLSLGLPQLANGKDLPMLKRALSDAHDNGAVIVAAAGNDSSNLKITAPAQLPAAYDFVIGVVATNKDGTKTCYSNKGDKVNNDLAAPGGDGGVFDEKYTCVSRSLTWTATPDPCPGAMGDCKYGLISLIKPRTQSTNGKWSHGYGYWSGTSFSTPLVSGLAALAYSQSNNQNEVYCLILNGAQMQIRDPNLGWGIINVPNSLSIINNCQGPQ